MPSVNGRLINGVRCNAPPLTALSFANERLQLIRECMIPIFDSKRCLTDESGI